MNVVNLERRIEQLNARVDQTLGMLSTCCQAAAELTRELKRLQRDIEAPPPPAASDKVARPSKRKRSGGDSSPPAPPASADQLEGPSTETQY